MPWATKKRPHMCWTVPPLLGVSNNLATTDKAAILVVEARMAVEDHKCFERHVLP
jgi:hypothetical protein